MASITLEYNARNSVANKIIDIIVSMDNIFKVKTHTSSKINLTRKAIEDVEKGNIITCESYDDYLNKTSEYA